MDKIKAYKIFENDWTCKNHKFEVGKTYIHEGELEMCSAGFHACINPIDCWKYYAPLPWNKFAEVELSGKQLTEEGCSKICAEKITVVREISFDEFVVLVKSDGINESNGINRSRGINESNGINDSRGINRSEGILNCFGLSKAMFTADKPHDFLLFGVAVDEERFENVQSQYRDLVGGWYPKFNNLHALYLKNGSEWKQTPIDKAEEIRKEEAWKDMPKEAVDYIKSLPEFNAEMFEKITGIK